MFNRIVFRTIAGIVCHADLNANVVDQGLQVLFEQVLIGSVASTAVAQQQDRTGVWIAAFADPIPVPAKTVTGEQAGVVAEANVDVTAVSEQIVDAVRDHQARGPTGEVVVEHLNGLLRPDAAFAIEQSETLLGFRVDGKHGISRIQILALKFFDVLKLRISVGRLASRDHLRQFVQCEIVFGQPVSHDMRTHRCSHRAQFRRNLGGREIGRYELRLIGVTRRSNIQKRDQVRLQLRFSFYFFFRPPPGARTRPAAGSSGSRSSSAAARSMVRVEQPNTSAI